MWIFQGSNEFRLEGKHYSYDDVKLDIIFFHEGFLYRYVTTLQSDRTMGNKAVFTDQHICKKKVFQEALLNALSHRDYQQLGAVYVKHYPDKIVIENPGGFLDGITEKNIITHPSVPRNKLIAETLQRLKYVQRTGQGVDIIFRERNDLRLVGMSKESCQKSIIAFIQMR